MSEPSCRVCNSPTQPIGEKLGRFSKSIYHLYHCPECRYSFVADPWLDYDRIYSMDYYRGKRGDPLVDYLFELEHPADTIRRYEWEGIVRLVQSLLPLTPTREWLDFGCGNGGFVRFVNERRLSRIVGFEEGAICGEAARRGVPLVSRAQLDRMQGSFDIVTAIEVLEHVPDPVSMLRRIRLLLKPGGLLFLTTGNARPHRKGLLRWRYVVPEIHVSFFEPETMALAMKLAGMKPEFRGFLPGFEQIIRFKVLKNLGVKSSSWLERLMPWAWISRIVDKRVQVTAHPIGWNENPSIVS